MLTRRGLAVGIDLFCPKINRFKTLGISQVEYYDYCITVLVIQGEKRAKALLASSIPDVHGDRFSSGINCVVAMEAGAKGVGHFVLEAAVE